MMKLKSYEIVIEQIIVNSFMVVKVTQEMSQYLQLCHKIIHPKYSKHLPYLLASTLAVGKY